MSTGSVEALTLNDAALRISIFVDELIKYEVSNIDRIVVAATPVIIAQVYKERENQDAR